MAFDHLNEFSLAKLARELAMNIRNYRKIFADFNISEDDYYEISKIEFFKRAKEQFALEWNSAVSAADRVRLISAAYVEEGLPAIGRGMLDEGRPMPERIEAAKYLARNAGIGEAKPTLANTDRFVININMGSDVEHYDKPVAIDVTPENAKVLVPPNKPDVD